jgi:hypothetical protein
MSPRSSVVVFLGELCGSCAREIFDPAMMEIDDSWTRLR